MLFSCQGKGWWLSDLSMMYGHGGDERTYSSVTVVSRLFVADRSCQLNRRTTATTLLCRTSGDSGGRMIMNSWVSLVISMLFLLFFLLGWFVFSRDAMMTWCSDDGTMFSNSGKGSAGTTRVSTKFQLGFR